MTYLAQIKYLLKASTVAFLDRPSIIIWLASLSTLDEHFDQSLTNNQSAVCWQSAKCQPTQPVCIDWYLMVCLKIRLLSTDCPKLVSTEMSIEYWSRVNHQLIDGWLRQGSNLTLEDNSQMASTWSRFTSHKCVSTSLGMCAAQNSHFYLTNNSNMRKCKTAVAINCSNITCIVRGLV